MDYSEGRPKSHLSEGLIQYHSCMFMNLKHSILHKVKDGLKSVGGNIAEKYKYKKLKHGSNISGSGSLATYHKVRTMAT